MRNRWTLTAKLVATGMTFLLLALASIGLTLWVTWNLEGGAAAVNEAGRMRMQTYRLALSLGTDTHAAEARALVRSFDNSLALLAAGDPSRPLFVPWSAASRQRFAAVQDRWAQLRPDWLEARAATDAKRQADALVALVDAFVDSIEAQIAYWTALLHMFQLAMMALAIGGAVAMMYAGYLLVLSPVARLKAGLAALQRGEMGARVTVDTRDEFGELSNGFNEMAATLQELYGSLEQKVQEKTQSLEIKRQRLADLYSVSELVARAPTLEALAQGFARKVRSIARADAVAVRWSDEANRRYHLLAADNLPAALAQAEDCLTTGQCHCGQAQASAVTRVIPIRPSQGITLPHCAEAGMRAVISVPVRLHDRVLGELDLFHRQPVTLSDEDRALLEALASHLASAIEGLRAAALEREAAVAEERGLLARELHDSIAQSLAFMKIQVQLLRGAMQRGDAVGIERGIGELETGVRECYADVRELLVHFRTRTSAESIEPALRTTLQKFEHQTGLSTRLELQDEGMPLAPDVQVQVLHIVQEALSNVRKHAHARHVTVRAGARPGWTFEVIDDGSGFDAEGAPPDQTHVGLRIMQERAARIGATVSLSSQPGQGCRVRLALPASATAAEAAAEATALAA